jgi:hypothetical protein
MDCRTLTRVPERRRDQQYPAECGGGDRQPPLRILIEPGGRLLADRLADVNRSAHAQPRPQAVIDEIASEAPAAADGAPVLIVDDEGAR